MQGRISRDQEVRRVRLRIERDSWPRLQMTLLVIVTGAAGFLASYGLFQLGLREMWSRYLVSITVAYLAFLILLWIWLRAAASDFENLADVDDVDLVHTEPWNQGTPSSWQSSVDDEPGFFTRNDNSTLGDGLGDADEMVVPIALIALVAGLLVSAFFVITAAPSLFAELIVDGVLSASLYRRLRGLQPSHWLEPALRRTFVPFVLTAVLVALAGWEMERHAPGAHTISQVLHPALRDPG